MARTKGSRNTGGKMSRSEAGQSGGRKTASTHGHSFYSQIGSEGGKAVSRDRSHMSEIGKKGGKKRWQG